MRRTHHPGTPLCGALAILSWAGHPPVQRTRHPVVGRGPAVAWHGRGHTDPAPQPPRRPGLCWSHRDGCPREKQVSSTPNHGWQGPTGLSDTPHWKVRLLVSVEPQHEVRAESEGAASLADLLVWPRVPFPQLSLCLQPLLGLPHTVSLGNTQAFARSLSPLIKGFSFPKHSQLLPLSRPLRAPGGPTDTACVLLHPPRLG